MRFSRSLTFTLAGSLVAASLLLVGCGDEEAKKVTIGETVFTTRIAHINDHHSHLQAEDMDLELGGVETEVTVGGFARVVSKIKQIQSSGENVLTLHAGDALQGTLFYSLFKTTPDAELMNLISWDAFELGNHEFDDGDANLATFLGKLNAPAIAANVVAPSGNVLHGLWTPYVIKDFGGEKVGIIGIDVASKTKESSNPSDSIVFLDEAQTAQKYVDELEAMGINKIVLLSHYGLDNDLALAEKVRGVDVIIDGDSHSLLGDYASVGLSSEGSYPMQTTSKSGEPVCIAQAWQYSYVVGDLRVGFDENGLVSSCAGNPVLLLGDTFVQNDAEVDATTKASLMNLIAASGNMEIVAEDSAAAAKVATYAEQVDTMKATVIGEASEVLGHNRIPGDTYDKVNTLPLGSDIAPIVSKSFYDLSNRADACIQNAGGVRIAVNPGDITMNTAYTLLPFANTLYEIEMKGSEIKQVLEDALVAALDNKSTGSFPYAYGLRFDVDGTKAANNRVHNLEIKNRATGTWSPISNDTLYVIVTNSYTAAGKDGYTTFKTVQDARGPGVDTYLDYAMSFVRYVEAKTAAGEKVSKLPADEHCIKSYTAPAQ